LSGPEARSQKDRSVRLQQILEENQQKEGWVIDEGLFSDDEVFVSDRASRQKMKEKKSHPMLLPSKKVKPLQ